MAGMSSYRKKQLTRQAAMLVHDSAVRNALSLRISTSSRLRAWKDQILSDKNKGRWREFLHWETIEIENEMARQSESE